MKKIISLLLALGMFSALAVSCASENTTTETTVTTETSGTTGAIVSNVIYNDKVPANEPPTGTETEQPFAVCNVWAEHPGYMMLSVRDVQIFPGVEAVQNMDLVPLEEGQFSLGQHTRRDIEPQGL